MDKYNILNEDTEKSEALPTACYIRLSREDGDKAESFSIINQRLQLTEFINKHKDLTLYDYYIDDGYTGTNFDRPAFNKMIQDIESKKVKCVIVKDLSRLGRNMAKVSTYVNEYFPSKRVRFIAVNDMIDKQFYDVDTSEDMIIDFKNMFNGFYPRDIASKVRSTFRSKQSKGQFIGAFATYGYKKSPSDHNKLIIDDTAANIVRRIYQMYLSGIGQHSIAKILNEEGIPCPTEYKKQCGLNYQHSSYQEGAKYYWLYPTIHKILKNEMYTGTMVQNKSFRQICGKKSSSLPKDKWIIVKNTHEAIIDRDTWEKVQDLMERNVRTVGVDCSIHKFAGFLKCGDCSKAMAKIKRKGIVYFNCSRYNKYGKKYCSRHNIKESEIEKLVLEDLNLIIKSIKNINQLIEEERQKERNYIIKSVGDISKYQSEIAKLTRKKERAYADYSDDIISREEYIKYKSMYENEISAIKGKIDLINQVMQENAITVNPWIDKLLKRESIEHLDRETIVEMISMIYVYENKTIKIIYNFSDELETLLGNNGVSQ